MADHPDLCLSAWVLSLKSGLVPCATIALVAPGVLLVDAGAAAGSPEVSKDTVQTQAAKVLAATTGQKPPKVTCPSGVAAKVGAMIHCTVVPYGMTLHYPATVTVRSIHGGTASFYVQVGQAPGQADKTAFCADNARINSTLGSATTSASFLAALRADVQTILDLQSTAPTKIVVAVGTLTSASRQALQSGKIAVFNTKAVARATLAIDTFCGQRATG